MGTRRLRDPVIKSEYASAVRENQRPRRPFALTAGTSPPPRKERKKKNEKTPLSERWRFWIVHIRERAPPIARRQSRYRGRIVSERNERLMGRRDGSYKRGFYCNSSTIVQISFETRSVAPYLFLVSLNQGVLLIRKRLVWWWKLLKFLSV